MKRSSTNRGFTLTEVVISIMLFSIMAVSSLRLMSWGVNANAVSIHTTDAMNEAQNKMEDLLAQGLVNITAGSDVNGIYTRSWFANDQGVPESVRVTVSWQGVDGRNHTVHINNIAQ